MTYFVHPDTALDNEAAERSTSTYLVDRRLDMVLQTYHDSEIGAVDNNIAFLFFENSVTRLPDYATVLVAIS